MRPLKLKHTSRDTDPAVAQLSRRLSVGYARRRIITGRQLSIDGFSPPLDPAKAIVPASQGDYIDSLSKSPVSYSRYRQQQTLSVPADDGFGTKLRLFVVRRQRFVKLKPFVPVAAIGLILLTAIVSLSGASGSRSAEAEQWGSRSSIEPIIDTNSEISEKRPNNIFNYRVAGDLPRFLKINGMGISSRVRRVGVGTKSELKLPSNIYDAGWYESSMKPGEAGAVVLTGHANGPTKPGIFHDLMDLEPGNELEIETGNGDIYKYYVAKLEVFSQGAPVEPMLATAVPGSPGLNLISELGRFDTKSNTFEKRLVVYCIQKSSSVSTSEPGSAIPNTR